jgi:60 kDa SS-A/Ro ribonucleoprotein
MSGPVTGYRRGATTAVRCVDVAALVAAAVLRKNSDAQVLPFDVDVNRVRLNPRDSVMTNAEKLAQLCGGGTDCSAPLRRLNRRRERVDLVWFVSDYESWAGPRCHRATGVMTEWEALRRRNSNARLVCLDVTPYDTSQTHDRADVLNLGGFSDHMFRLVAAFASGALDAGHWVAEIEHVDLGVIGKKAA